MAVTINGQQYYRTSEVCEIAGISRATFHRWLQEGILEDIRLRDRNGWRLFDKEDIARIISEVSKTTRGDNHGKTGEIKK